MDAKTIRNFIMNNDDPKLKQLKDNFTGVFPVDKLTTIVDTFDDKIYPYCIFNTDKSTESGTHWCGAHILNDNDGLPKFFLFDSFGALGLKAFFIQNDVEILDDIITNFNEFKSDFNDDNELAFNFFKWNIDCRKYLELPTNKMKELSPTCVGFFNLLMSYLRYNNKKYGVQKNNIELYGIKDQLQNVERTTCGLFVLYYFYNLFSPQKYYDLNKTNGDINTVKKLLPIIFATVNEENDKDDLNFILITEFKNKHNIKAKLIDKELLKTL